MKTRTVYVSGTVLLRINAAALNQAESTGNFSKHRTYPFIVVEDNRVVKVVYVPAISGQSLGHGYQRFLSILADQRGINVCGPCREEIFVKMGTIGQRGETTKGKGKKSKKSEEEKEKLYDLFELEFEDVKRLRDTLDEIRDDKEMKVLEKYRRMAAEVEKNCIVEDVGGFMVPRYNLRKTSTVSFSPAIPVSHKAGGVTSAQHARHGLVVSGEEEGQMIYQVGVASALYQLSFEFEPFRVSVFRRLIGEKVDDWWKRVEAAIDAFYFLEAGEFGGHRARYLPIMDVYGFAIAVAEPYPFRPSPVDGELSSFIIDTVRRGTKVSEFFNNKEKIMIYYNMKGLDKEIEVNGVAVEKVESLLDAIKAVKERLAGSQP